MLRFVGLDVAAVFLGTRRWAGGALTLISERSRIVYGFLTSFARCSLLFENLKFQH